MIKNKHNQYVSTPDWFSNKPTETIQTTQSVQPVVVSSSSDTIIQQEPLALHQLTDVASDDNGVIGAVEGSVLKFDGTNWYGDKIDINIPEGGIEYLLKEVFSKIFTAYDIDGNVVDITDINSIINDISINYNLWSKGYLSALGRQSDISSGSIGALYQLVDVLADEDKVQGAEKGSILRYDGTHWYAGTDEGFNIGSLEDYLVSQKYLTESQADALFLTEEEGDARYLLKTVFTKLFTAYDASGKMVDITDFNTDIDNVSINYSLWSPGYISAQGRQDGGESGSSVALYQLTDVLSDGNKVQGAEEGSVLKYNGTHWYADEDKGFDTSKLEEYLTSNEYLTKDAADNLFLTPDEGDELFLTQDEGDTTYLLRTVFSTIFTAYDVDGNKVDITDSSTAIDNISVNYNFWSKGYVSALGKQDNESTDGITALHQLIDVAANDDDTAVKNAEKGSVLTYDGTHWYGSKINIDNSIDENEIVAINDKYKYATQKWVEDKKYITDAYSKKEVDDKIATVNSSITTTNTNVKNLTTKVDNLIQLVEKEEDAINGDDGVLYILQ